MCLDSACASLAGIEHAAAAPASLAQARAGSSLSHQGPTRIDRHPLPPSAPPLRPSSSPPPLRSPLPPIPPSLFRAPSGLEPHHANRRRDPQRHPVPRHGPGPGRGTLVGLWALRVSSWWGVNLSGAKSLTRPPTPRLRLSARGIGCRGWPATAGAAATPS
jgi:hypothetical protein